MSERLRFRDELVHGLRQRGDAMPSERRVPAKAPAGTLRYFGVRQAAPYLARSEKALYHLVARREIPFIKQGRRLLFDRLALDRWMARGLVDAPVRRVVHSPSSRESAPEARG